MLYYGLTWRPATDNLGDDLVTLAALEQLPRVDHVLDVNALDAPVPGLSGDDRLVTLATGLFLRSSAHWPPDEHIALACIGVHLSSEDAWGLPLATLDGAGLDALAACAPISARDVRTAKRLAQLDIPHQLTGSLVLTLDHPPCPRSGVVCCDAPEEVVTALQALRRDVTVTTHAMPDPSPDFSVRMENARAMLHRYAGAEMVFTRRLHCAMACLALGTPVLLLYHPEYEDVSRFAPMDAMFRKQPVEEFLQEVHLHGMPSPWRNPADVGAIQRILRSAVHDSLERARTMPLPAVQPEIALNWRHDRIRRMMKSAAGKIQRLENQHYEELHAKFSQLLLEEDVRDTLRSLIALPEVQSALRSASLRLQLEPLPPREQKELLSRHKRSLVDVDDLIRQAEGALTQLGWPEHDED